MYRHVRESCKVANSDEGMEKLMEYTLQRQLATQSGKVDALQAQVAELTTLLKSQLTVARPDPAPPMSKTVTNVVGPATVNTGPVTHNGNNITQINIQSWKGEDRIFIPASLLKATFTENARLAEYCRMNDEDKTNAEKAAPYVLEALVDLVRRAHSSDPAARNIYLSPNRADQVMVYDETWKVLTLVNAIRDLFDSVAGKISHLILTDMERRKLPLDVQSAASWVPSLYEEAPEKYVERARAPLSAHLANNRPGVTKP